MNAGTGTFDPAGNGGRKNGQGSGYGGPIPERDYGSAPGQLGNESGGTFWEAARAILEQVYLCLRPGAVACFVCKDFVRKGERVPFSQDWARLCEACGLVPFLWVKASLNSEERHPSLFGGDEVKTRSRKSFFRRLAERKGAPEISEEDVIFTRKEGRP